MVPNWGSLWCGTSSIIPEEKASFCQSWDVQSLFAENTKNQFIHFWHSPKYTGTLLGFPKIMFCDWERVFLNFEEIFPVICWGLCSKHLLIRPKNLIQFYVLVKQSERQRDDHWDMSRWGWDDFAKLASNSLCRALRRPTIFPNCRQISERIW